MRYGQEHLLDSKTHTRLTDGWKELIGVGAGTDRAMLEEMYSDDGEELGIPWVCTLTLFALKDPPEEMTYEKVKAAVHYLCSSRGCFPFTMTLTRTGWI